MNWSLHKKITDFFFHLWEKFSLDYVMDKIYKIFHSFFSENDSLSIGKILRKKNFFPRPDFGILLKPCKNACHTIIIIEIVWYSMAVFPYSLLMDFFEQFCWMGLYR